LLVCKEVRFVAYVTSFNGSPSSRNACINPFLSIVRSAHYATFPNLPASHYKCSVGVNAAVAGVGIRFPEAVEVMAQAFHPEAFATTL